MNRTLLSATTLAVALFGSTAALAQEVTPDNFDQAVSTKTRAEVQAELVQARTDGSIRFASSAYMEPLRVSAPRAQIQTELVAARANGQFAAINALVPSAGQRVPTVTVIRVAGN